MQNTTSRSRNALVAGLGLSIVAFAANANPVDLESGSVTGEIQYNQLTGEYFGSGMLIGDAGTADVSNFDLSASLVTWDLVGGGPDGDFSMVLTGVVPAELGLFELTGSHSFTESRTSFGLFGTRTLPPTLQAFLNLGAGITQFDLLFSSFGVTGTDGDWVTYSTDPMNTSFGMFGTPSPGALSLLAMGGVLAARRRR